MESVKAMLPVGCPLLCGIEGVIFIAAEENFRMMGKRRFQ